MPEQIITTTLEYAVNGDTNPAVYSREAASLAWERTLAFFKANLS